MITRKPFFFLRHGETDHNAKKILAGGDCDVPLNDNGFMQAEKIRPFIEGLPIQVIYHSPMLRAKQTMERASQNFHPNRIEIEELRECPTDVWLEMNRLQSQRRPIPTSTQTFFSQVVTGMLRVLESDAIPLIIAHGGVHFALCHLLSIENHPKYIENCALVHFSPEEENSWTAKKAYP